MKRLLSVFEAKDAVDNGADEVDTVINLGWVKDNRFDLVEEEIRKIKEAVGDKILKVIIETCLLTEEEKIGMCRAVTAAGADYIKTSTGFSKAGATSQDVELFARYVGEDVKIKAAGGISSCRCRALSGTWRRSVRDKPYCEDRKRIVEKL